MLFEKKKSPAVNIKRAVRKTFILPNLAAKMGLIKRIIICSIAQSIPNNPASVSEKFKSLLIFTRHIEIAIEERE